MFDCVFLTFREDFDCDEKKCEDNIFNFLKKNFDSHYFGERSPFGLYTHHSWFNIDEINESTAHTNGYLR